MRQMALKLLSTEPGKYGIIRKYRHARLGQIATLTLWRERGAHVIYIAKNGVPHGSEVPAEDARASCAGRQKACNPKPL